MTSSAGILNRHSGAPTALLVAAVFSGCHSGGGGGSNAPPASNTPPTVSGPPPAASAFNLALAPPKTFRFTWSTVANATFYRVLENPDGRSGYSQVGSDITQGTLTFNHVVPLFQRVNASYILESCNGTGCNAGPPLFVNGSLAEAVGYFKASNTGELDRFGRSLALSGDGSTLAVGASLEESSAAGIDGDQSDNSAPAAGAVYVFSRNGDSWSQEAYIKASNSEEGDQFGDALALSDDGATLAVGAPGEASVATGIDGDQTDNSADDAGAVYVFIRSAGIWSQHAYIKASNTGVSGPIGISGDQFGDAVALSGDGTTLAVGAFGEDSSANGVDGSQTDNSAADAGAVYVFTRNGSAWSQHAYVKASNSEANDTFGVAVALSGDGTTLAVGAIREDGSATGIDGNQTDNSAEDAGAVYAFTRSGNVWSQQAYVKASDNTGVTSGLSDDWFGYSLALNADGSVLAVGALQEASSARGIGGDQASNLVFGAGAAYVFTRDSGTWSQRAYVKASNTHALAHFGHSVALSGTGRTLAVAADGEFSSATGIGGDQSDASSLFAGAVYLY